MNKSLLLIITGGIAAYKALEFIRQINRQGFTVIPVLTKAAEAFVTPLSVAGVAGGSVHTEMLSMTAETEIGHIALSRQADAILVYPATADFMAKAAYGHANDLASTLLLATDKPVLMTPAMNVRMWEHAATQQNIKTLRERGITIFEPDVGNMACGEYGAGRLIEPPVMVDHMLKFFNKDKPLKGKTALVTTGATQEALDPVRYLSNHSSGQQGFTIADALQQAGASVTVVAGVHTTKVPTGLNNIINVVSAAEMYEATISSLPVDIAVCAAAVSDWTPLNPADQKQKKQPGQENYQATFAKTKDILAALGSHQNRPNVLIGFAAETENGLAHAKEKLSRKKCDWIVLNEVSKDNPAFGAEVNQVTIIQQSQTIALDKMPKTQVANHIVELIQQSICDKTV